jgi:hypothetical protein
MPKVFLATTHGDNYRGGWSPCSVAGNYVPRICSRVIGCLAASWRDDIGHFAGVPSVVFAFFTIFQGTNRTFRVARTLWSVVEAREKRQGNDKSA